MLVATNIAMLLPPAARVSVRLRRPGTGYPRYWMTEFRHSVSNGSEQSMSSNIAMVEIKDVAGVAPL